MFRGLARLRSRATGAAASAAAALPARHARAATLLRAAARRTAALVVHHRSAVTTATATATSVARAAAAQQPLQRCAFATASSSSSSSSASKSSSRNNNNSSNVGAGIRSASSGSVPQYSSALSPHTVLAFTHRNTDVYVVGTAHISARSADEVAQVIERVQPDAIMVELDPARAQRLQEQAQSSQNGGGGAGGVWSTLFRGLMGMRGASSGGDMLGSGLKLMYDYLRAKGFQPGAEFAVAMREAKKRGVELVFGDQQSTQTFRNLASTVTLQRLLQVVQNPVYAQKLARVEHAVRQRMAEYNARHPETALTKHKPASADSDPFSLDSLTMWVEALKNRETARMLVDLLDSELPELTQSLLHDRDRHMWLVIDELCDPAKATAYARRHGGQRRAIVAVVGFAHLDGIERLFRRADGANKLHGGGGGGRGGATPNVIPLPPPSKPATPDVIHL